MEVRFAIEPQALSGLKVTILKNSPERLPSLPGNQVKSGQLFRPPLENLVKSGRLSSFTRRKTAESARSHSSQLDQETVPTPTPYELNLHISRAITALILPRSSLYRMAHRLFESVKPKGDRLKWTVIRSSESSWKGSQAGIRSRPPSARR